MQDFSEWTTIYYPYDKVRANELKYDQNNYRINQPIRTEPVPIFGRKDLCDHM